jgi:RHS repeat-associated protein
MQAQFMYDGTPHFVHYAYWFTGKERDTESGLDNFEARYFASTIGRYMSPDYDDEPSAVPFADFSNPQTLTLSQSPTTPRSYRSHRP